VTFIIDASFAHAEMTPSALRGIGASGAILYAGCDYAPKNATRAEVQALLSAGLMVGLVIENFATDALKGAVEGARQGRNIRAAAVAMGYDVDHCVLFAGADWNTQANQEPAVDAFMAAFAREVGVPGFYGNSYAIDYVATGKHAQVFWQSDSTSFSYGPSPHAHLLQRFDDPRARGLALDVNDIQNTPLRLMGEADMALDANDPQVRALNAKLDEILDRVGGHDDFPGLLQHGDAAHPNSLDGLAARLDKIVGVSLTDAQIAAIAAAVAAKLPAAGGFVVESTITPK
jgi:glycoside hydrolase-like protein